MQWRDPDILRASIEHIEAQEAEKKTIADDIKDTYDNLETLGFDKDACKEIVRRRKKAREDVEAVDEEVSELEGYLLI